MSDTSNKEYLPGPATARRYNVSGRTIARWTEDPDLNFPRPLIINGRLFYPVDQLENWERLRASNKRAA